MWRYCVIATSSIFLLALPEIGMPSPKALPSCSSQLWKFTGTYVSSQVVGGKLQDQTKEIELPDRWDANDNFFDQLWIQSMADSNPKNIRVIISHLPHTKKKPITRREVAVTDKRVSLGAFKDLFDHPVSTPQKLFLTVKKQGKNICTHELALQPMD